MVEYSVGGEDAFLILPSMPPRHLPQGNITMRSRPLLLLPSLPTATLRLLANGTL